MSVIELSWTAKNRQSEVFVSFSFVTLTKVTCVDNMKVNQQIKLALCPFQTLALYRTLSKEEAKEKQILINLKSYMTFH